MAEVFGTDIRQLVGEAFAGQLRPGVISRYDDTKSMRDPDDPTKFVPGTPKLTSACECFVSNKTVTAPGTLETREQVQVLIIGASTTFIPAVNDMVAVDNETYCLVRLLSSDSSEAVYTFEAS